MSGGDLEARLADILRQAPSLMGVMEIARDLALPDWMIFSGAIYQKAVNHLTGRDLDYGLKDYDLGYFDAADLSYEAEDRVIRRAAAAYPPPLDTMFAVGARLEPDGTLRIFAPFGLEDLFALRLRPNPTRPTMGFARTAEAAMARWPELTLAD
ncbi:MAG TPA: nucleotidyltransferase family protein [Phenylobacterium sp.]|nr:nucleotidyltransferase family protein [Phenylobacterium sp.]